MQPPAQGRPPQQGRGRGPARWTPWEITLIVLSLVMIAFPLYAEMTRLIFAPPVPAQEAQPFMPEPPGEGIDQGPTITSSPTLEPTPTDTPTVTNTPEGGDPPTPTDTPTITTTPTDGPSPTPTDTPTVTNTPEGGESPTPTNTPTATVTNTPAPVSGVQVFKFTSVDAAAPGQEFSFSVSVITDSSISQRVTMTDQLDPNLELVSIRSNIGGCALGPPLSCTFDIRDTEPAAVTIQVRVRNNATPGSTITNVASANGRGSAPVSVRVLSGAVTPVPTTPTTVTPVTVVPTTVTPVTVVPTTVTPVTVVPTPVTPVTVTPTDTPLPLPPTVPPPPPTAAPPPPPDPGPGGGGGGDTGGGQIIAPPAPPTPMPAVPTEPPTPAPPAGGGSTVRPTAAVPPTRVPAPQTPTNTPASLTPSPGITASPTAIGGQTDEPIFLRMASDWGSAYPGQQVNLTLVVRNDRVAAADGSNNLRNLDLRSALPTNLEVLGARADRGADPTVNGQQVTHTLDTLAPGEAVELTIATRIRPNVAAGTLLVVQGELRYEGLAQSLFSNIVSIQVVGNLQPTAAPIQTLPPGSYPPPGSPGPTATSGPTMTSGPTSPPAATALPPTADPTQPIGQQPTPQPPVATPTPPPAPLPETTAGIPMLGILLLGLTMLTRTWRLHRARERI
ncbi:MAG: hypothetical protein AB4911_05040 [Oscillochloridaceae bacterium umkhey_bin13]